MFMKRVLFAAIVLLFSVNGIARATHTSPVSGYGHTGPITTVSAETLQKGQWGFEVQTEFMKFDRFSDRELLDFARSDKEIHNVDYVQTYSLGMSYGITEKISMHLQIPYTYRNNIEESEPPDEIHRHGDSKGLGDAAIHLHHRFVRVDNLNFDSSLLFGLKIPSGRTSAKDLDNNRFDAEFQPGSGSWDPSLGIAATKRMGVFSVDANLLYTIVTEGTQDTDLGDKFNYNVSFSYRAVRNPIVLDFIIESNGIWIQKEEIDGKEDENSGGNIIFLSPGIRFTCKDRLTVYLSSGFPILQDLNGKQNDVSYRIVLGLTILL